MTQRELNREVASQTGESIQTIQSLGFSPLREIIPVEERQEPLMVDWDEVDRNRNLRVIIWTHVKNWTNTPFGSLLPREQSLVQSPHLGSFSFWFPEAWLSQELWTQKFDSAQRPRADVERSRSNFAPTTVGAFFLTIRDWGNASLLERTAIVETTWPWDSRNLLLSELFLTKWDSRRCATRLVTSPVAFGYGVLPMLFI